MDEKSIFLDALNKPAGNERTVWLNQICGNDLSLRERVDALLRRHEQAGDFLEQPPAEFEAPIIPDISSQDRAKALQAGLAAAFADNEAFVIGNSGHSVLTSLGQSIQVPHIVLRESKAEGDSPITRPKSPEMPPRDSDSRYRLDGEIARGGMGAILKGRDTDLGRDLAIKVLLDQHKDKPEIIQRFVEEAQIGGQLQHPGIAPIYELGQFADKRPFFAMKLVKGETLSKLLANRENASDDRGKFIGIYEQVCQTMAYAHSRGVIHRDLKPSNIMVGAFGEVQVMDWGLAKVLAAGGIADEKKAHDRQQGQSIIQTQRNQVGSEAAPVVFGTLGSQTQMGSVMGTPAYMPPEQALGEIDNLDERADVFGLGAILCEVLTGKPPYVDDGAMRVFRMAARGRLEHCMQRLDACGADPELITLTKHCLELEPADRPRDAGILASRVTEYIESVEMRLRQAEVERAAQAARADAQAAQAAAERQRAEAQSQRAEAERQRAESEARRVEQQQRSASKLRKMLGGLAVVALVAGIACVAALMANNRANDLAGIASRNEAEAKYFASEATAKARLASDHAARAEAEAALARRAEQTARELATAEAAAKSIAQQETQRAETATEQAKAQLTRSEWLLYASRLMLAQNDFESSHGGLAAHYLDECQPNLRGWEHRYLLKRVTARQTMTGHTNTVNSVAFSPDGKRIVTGSWDQTARVWDAATGQGLLTLQGLAGNVMCVAFSPDGQRIATAGGPRGTGRHPGEVKLWNAVTGEWILDLIGHDDCVWSMAFSPDGRRIVTGGGDWAYGPGEVKVWDAGTGKEIMSLQEDIANVRGVAFSPDGLRLATGSIDNAAKVWDATNGQRLLTLEGHGNAVQSVAFSPDGKHIVTGAGAWGSGNGESKVWDAVTGESIMTLTGHNAAVLSVTFSPDGQRIATGGWDQTIKVWDTQSGQEVLTLKGHTDRVRCVAFSPDGRRIVSSSDDQTAKVWDANKGQEISTLKGHTDGMTNMAFSANSQRLVTGNLDNTARVWNTASGQEVLRLRMHSTYPSMWDVAAVWGVAISSDGRRIATASQDKTARVWDAATGRELLVIRHASVVSGVAFSPDGKRLVTGSFDNSARVWDVITGEELFALNGHSGYVNQVAWSLDGKRIVTGSWDHTAKVWDAATAEEFFTLRGHAGYVMCLAISPDSTRIVTGSFDNTAKVWDAATGQELMTLRGHTGGAVRSVAFSPDGTRIVTGSDDRTAKLWDTGTGHEVLTLPGHTEAVYAVAWSPDGNRIVTGIAGATATAKVWDAATARELLVLAGHTEIVTSVAFSDDGQRISAWDAQKNVLVWSVASGASVAPNDPPPEPIPGPARSPDGFYYAVPEGTTVVVSDTSPLPENTWPLPNAIQRIRYHSEKAATAKKANHLFAAEFHLQQVTLAETELAHTADVKRNDVRDVEGTNEE